MIKEMNKAMKMLSALVDNDTYVHVSYNYKRYTNKQVVKECIVYVADVGHSNGYASPIDAAQELIDKIHKYEK